MEKTNSAIKRIRKTKDKSPSSSFVIKIKVLLLNFNSKVEMRPYINNVFLSSSVGHDTVDTGVL